jgi:DNA-binding transcriptional regulator YdaS (Cro superfamily)
MMGDMSTSILEPSERRRLAEKYGLSDAYLYQCMRGFRSMEPGKARQIEELSGGELMRWHMCPKTWRAIWPELAEHPAAPRVTETQE